MNPDKLLSLLMGKCLKHQWDKPSNEWGVFTCKLCGAGSYKPFTKEITPSDFSDPRRRDEFFTWLCRERGEMWDAFEKWALREYIDLFIPAVDAFIPWLFFIDPSRPRDLMAEWLQLDETVERFGWEECPEYVYCTISDGEDGSLDWCKNYDAGECDCNPFGKVLSPWAQYAKEGKDG